MPLEFIYLNSHPVVAVNCDKRKAMGKEKWHKVKFEKSKRMIAQSSENKKQKKQKNKQTNKQTKDKKKTKWKSNFKSTNS